MKLLIPLTLILSLLLMTGCASRSGSDLSLPPLAIPLQPSLEQEVKIAQLTDILNQPNLPKNKLAALYAKRAIYYNSVGLNDLARVDLQRSIALVPTQGDVFNLLGVYLLQMAQYDAAYEAFDAAIELNPKDSYAMRNQAIAFYYGGRLPLAKETITQSYRTNPKDPFTLIWQYYIDVKLGDKNAYQTLEQAYLKVDNNTQDWGWLLVGVTLGKISSAQLFALIESPKSPLTNNTKLAHALTEAYFYLGKYYQQKEDSQSAIALMKLAIAFNVYGYIEHGFAFLEIERLMNQLNTLQITQPIATKH